MPWSYFWTEFFERNKILDKKNDRKLSWKNVKQKITLCTAYGNKGNKQKQQSTAGELVVYGLGIEACARLVKQEVTG